MTSISKRITNLIFLNIHTPQQHALIYCLLHTFSKLCFHSRKKYNSFLVTNCYNNVPCIRGGGRAGGDHFAAKRNHLCLIHHVIKILKDESRNVSTIQKVWYCLRQKNSSIKRNFSITTQQAIYISVIKWDRLAAIEKTMITTEMIYGMYIFNKCDKKNKIKKMLYILCKSSRFYYQYIYMGQQLLQLLKWNIT